jgi:hypothetical protein
MPSASARDPFARPGQPGNRSIEYGLDAPVPGRYRKVVEEAILLAYNLAFMREFRFQFNTTVGGLSGKALADFAYLEALDRMVINLAEGSRNPAAVKELKEDAASRRIDKVYQSPAAFSVVGGRDVWLREFLLRKGDAKEIAGALMHEAAHVAGAPGNPLAEIALEALGTVSGYQRR